MAEWVAEELEELAPYNAYDAVYPERIPGTAVDRVGYVVDLLNIASPYAISTVVSLGWPQRSGLWHVYTAGTFRKKYLAIERLAEALADYAMEYETIPVIHPLFAYDWTGVRAEGPTSRIRRHGLVLYSRRRQ